MRVRAFAPGRVNLIGDHTDTTGGLVLPMAIHLGTTVDVERGGDEVRLRSDTEAEPAAVALDVADPAQASPAWARYVAGVVAAVRPAAGAVGTVATTLPVGAGLSSSAALEVAVALALGFTGSPVALASACQRAEHAASGVPSGIMDQLASAAGVAGAALLIDCTTLERTPVPLGRWPAPPTPSAGGSARRRRPRWARCRPPASTQSSRSPTRWSGAGPGTW